MHMIVKGQEVNQYGLIMFSFGLLPTLVYGFVRCVLLEKTTTVYILKMSLLNVVCYVDVQLFHSFAYSVSV